MGLCREESRNGTADGEQAPVPARTPAQESKIKNQKLINTQRYRLSPRALIAHMASTRSPRIATTLSCRLNVGSQCPGTKRILSPSAGLSLASSACKMLCSSCTATQRRDRKSVRGGKECVSRGRYRW